MRDLDLFLGNVEGGISVELDGTDTEVGSAEVAGKIEALVLLVCIMREAVRVSRPSQFHREHLSRRSGFVTWTFHLAGGPRLWYLLVVVEYFRPKFQHTHLSEEMLDGLAHIVVRVFKVLCNCLCGIGERWNWGHLGSYICNWRNIDERIEAVTGLCCRYD